MMPQWTVMFDPSGRGVPITWWYFTFSLLVTTVSSLIAIFWCDIETRAARIKWIKANAFASVCIFFGFWFLALIACGKDATNPPPASTSMPAGTIRLYYDDGTGHLVPLGAELREAD